jgi:hypothetical protein
MFLNLRVIPGLKFNPALLAYDTGPRQGNTTTAQKKMRMAPKLQVYRASVGV